MANNIETATEIAQYADLLLRRRWILVAVTAIVLLTTALVTFTTRPVFQASTLVIIEKERGGGALYSNGVTVESSDADYYQTQYKLLQSESLTQRVYEDLRLADSEEFRGPNGIQRLRRAITVTPVLRSRLVYVRAESIDPAQAARVSNSLAETFVEQNLSNQLFISKEVLAALRKNQGDSDTREVYGGLPAVVNNPLIQTLKSEYARIEAESADLSRRYTARHPAMAAMQLRMGTLARQIEAETDKIVQSLKTDLSGQLKGNNVRIVDPARVPDYPVRPKKRSALLLGLAIGLAAGIGVVFLVESLDQSVRAQEDVEARLGLPFLGLLPHTGTPVVPGYKPLLNPEPSLTSEAFRNLRTMVGFAESPLGSTTLLVTSSVQEEGKTYVSSNLGVVFAQLGQKVLLIDGDLRRPNLHKSLGISATRGLSDYLARGESVDGLEDLLQTTEVPGLRVLPCGPRPPNPAELLNTPKLTALLAWAQTQFDRVIIDCTPVFPISDTLLWGRIVRSAVFVVRYGMTRIPLIRTARQRLETGGLKILGVAVNGSRTASLSYAPYGYYYQQYYKEYRQVETISTS